MLMLALGLLLFAAVHLVPSLAPGARERWRDRLGTNGYQGVFSLLLLAALALIIVGWRGATPAYLYAPVAGLRGPALALLAFAFLLFTLGKRPSRLRRLIRHPQLTGVSLWGVAHLLLNGDSRALLLFGGMTVWALVEIIAINRRDGVWIKGAVPGWGGELRSVLVAAVVVAVVIAIHPWLSGRPVFPT